MNDNAILVVLGAVIVLALIIPSVDAAKIMLEGGLGFCQILAFGNDTIICNSENSTATFVGGDNISITAFPLNDTIRIDSTGGSGGEANTASNVGTGSGWFKQKTGVNLEFLSVLGENGIIITPNANDITLGLSNIPKTAISSTGTFAESDIPTLSKSKISAIGTFSWTEISKSGSSVHDISNVTSKGCASGKILKVNSTGYFACATDEIGVGEANTASNSGHGQSLVLTKVGVDLPFKGIACGGSITCTNNSTDVIISYDTTARESTVGVWTVDSVKTTIGTSFADVYTSGQGDPLRIDTNGKTTATLVIDWTNIGIGTQTCQIVSTTNSAIVLIRFNDLVSGLNTNATQDIPANAENIIDTFKPQCKSTTAIDAPIWLTGQVLLR